MRILALDISTTHIGFTIMDTGVSPRELEIGCVDLHLIKDYNKKLDRAIEDLELLINKYEVKLIVSEEFAKGFAPGKSSADVIIRLAGFHMTLIYVLQRLTGVETRRINVRSARATIGIRIPAGTDTKQRKQYILDEMLKVSSSPALRLTKRSGAPADCCFDSADSLVIARAWSKLG